MTFPAALTLGVLLFSAIPSAVAADGEHAASRDNFRTEA